MLIETLEKFAASFDPCLVVLRPDDDDIAQLVRTHFKCQVEILASPNSHLGMGASLADSVQQIIAEHHPLHALFVGHGDMPFVRASSLKKLRNTMERLSRAIVRPQFNGSPGHPVGFTSDFLIELSRLSGDIGARTVLDSHSDKVRLIDIRDPGVCLDRDTPT